jgi:uncharacterized membrane protein (UPF0127 family)
MGQPSPDAVVNLDQVRGHQRLGVLNVTRGTPLADSLLLALGPWSRLRGLLGRAPLADGQGMLLRPCRGVHTLFMGQTIDVLFLDPRGAVVGLRANLRPWRLTPIFPEALATLELPAGTIAASQTREGDRLVLVESVGVESPPRTARDHE